MGSNFEVLQLIWAILSLPKSIERGVLYTWQLWQVFHDPSTSTSRLPFLMDVSIYYKSDL